MTRAQHAKVLTAYLGRLNMTQLATIEQAARACAYAGMNLGVRAQVDAHTAFEQAVSSVVSSMIDHDLGLIASVIEAPTLARVTGIIDGAR